MANGRLSGDHVQANHGFTRLLAVRFNGSNWVRAAAGDAGVGIVGSVYDANVFEFVQLGELDGLSGLTPGSLYYIGTNGVLTTTVSGAPVFQAYTVDRGFVLGGNQASTTSVSRPEEAATTAARVSALETRLASDETRLSELEASEAAEATVTGQVTDGEPDDRYVRRDIWVVDVDSGGFVIDVDRLLPVYVDDDSVVTVPAPSPVADLGSVSVNGTVSCCLLVGYKLYIGGLFTGVTDASGTLTRNYAACLDLATGLWTAWDPNVTGTGVAGLAQSPDGAAIFLVGTFTAVGGSSRTNAAKVDAVTGALDTWATSAALNAAATGVTCYGSLVYISGAFTGVGATTRYYFAAFGLTTGTLDSWDVRCNGPAFGTNPYGLAPVVDESGNMYVAGGFVSVNGGGAGNDRYYSAKVSPSTGTKVSAWDSPLAFDASGNTEATILVLKDGVPVVGKSFGFTGSNRVVKADPTTGAAVAGFVVTTPDHGAVDTGAVAALTWDPAGAPTDVLYAGGTYSAINGVSRVNLCTISPITGTPVGTWAPAPNDTVTGLVFLAGKIIAVGAFTTIGGKSRGRLAAIDAATGIVS